MQIETTADWLVSWLERNGINTVFGIPGGAVLPLYHALGRARRLRHVLARHEQAAGFMAQGQARLTGRAGVVLVSSGPGVTNLVTAVADAHADSVPLVCICGQVPRALIGTDAFQEVDTCALMRPVAKHTWFIESPRQLVEILPQAFATAETGRPGPVILDLPKDVQAAACAALGSACRPPTTVQLQAVATSTWARVADWIDAARRPVLYVGGGIRRAGAVAELQALAEHAHIPVAQTLMALGCLPPDHPQNLGMLGMHGARATNAVIDASDLVIAIGARFDDRATGDPRRFAAAARVIHIDSDGRQLGKIRRPDLAIQADAKQALTALLGRCRRRRRRAWQVHVQATFRAMPVLQPGREDAATAYGAIAAAATALPDDAIITTDVGQHQMWVAQAFPFGPGHRWLTSGGLGTMGFGLPAAIGAALTRPAATVACFSGDGSLMMNVQELATLGELGLNVKIVLLDNGGLGLVRQQQALFYESRYVASAFRGGHRFEQLADAFGLTYCRGVARGTLQAALAAAGPALIHVPIDPDCQVLPMVVPGGANADALDHPGGADGRAPARGHLA